MERSEVGFATIFLIFSLLFEQQAETKEDIFILERGLDEPAPSTRLKRARRNQDLPPLNQIYQLKENQTNRFSVWDATNFTCGQDGFCDKTHWTGNKLCSFECKPQCQCDDQCHIFGDCCPDIQFQNNSDVPSVASPHISCLTKTWTKWDDFSSVLMVDSCPVDSSVSRDMVKKCQEPDNTLQDQATPVITRFENITYRNMFCSQCHGKTDYEGWRHQVSCEDGTKLTGVRSKDELWRLIIGSPENCNIETSPPQGFQARQCEENIISHCNETGEWIEYDSTVSELCNLYDHHVQYYGPETVYKAYKNIFCAICNGAELNWSMECKRVAGEGIPYPLSVLLDFNPVSKAAAEENKSKEQHDCLIGQVFDPLMATCRSIGCPETRVLDGDSCIIPYSTSNGLGVRFSALLQSANDSAQDIPQIKNGKYVNDLKAALVGFQPFIVHNLSTYFFSKDRLSESSHFSGDETNIVPFPLSYQRRIVSGEIILLSSRPFADFETTLLHFLYTDWTLFDGVENFTHTSSPRFCGSSQELEGYIMSGSSTHAESYNILHYYCWVIDCERKTAIYSLSLDYPFLEYNMSLAQNFTYNSTENSVTFTNFTIFLNDSDVLFCDKILRLSLGSIAHISKSLVEKQDNNNNIGQPMGSGSQMNFTMAIVSLVCIILSLIALVLTFIIYSIIPKLRSLPGLNTMALIFHLFCAQLIFLIGSNRPENKTACKALGVCIHFFWIATFSWTGVSAYHMHSVFAKLRPMSNLPKEIYSTYYKYWALCFVLSVLVIFACILYALVRSNWDEIGYGGRICFINDAIVIGIFFAGPLGLVLLINLIFFVLTVFAIRRVPNMSDRSNRTNRHHFFVYVKLSLLFGFAWIFGILAAIFNSDVLWYIFIVLSGTQGLLLFVAYCVNKRILGFLKTTFAEHGLGSSIQSDKPAHHHKSHTSTTTASSSGYIESSNKADKTSNRSATE